MSEQTGKPKVLSLKVLDAAIKESNQAQITASNEINEKIGGLETDIGKMLEILSAKQAPAITTAEGIDSRDAYQEMDRVDIEFKKNPDVNADVEVIRPGLASIHCAEFKDKMDQHKFDMEPVEIMVMPSASTYPDHSFTVGVNGRLRLIVRGRKQFLPRCYVEVLLRAKVSNYGNNEVISRYNNEMTVENPETKSHRYPLQIISDKNPLGAQWLERVSNDVRV